MYILIKILVAALLLSGLALAQDPYEVSSIRLDVSGGSDQAAKKQALSLAESQAFDRLLSRLLLSQDIKPSLKDKYKGSALSLLIADLQISDERFGSGRYLANATVRFKPREIRRIFNENKLPYAETYSAPLLVIATQKRSGRAVLWGDNNALLQALKTQELPKGLLPYVAPYGDIEDISLLNLSQAQSFRNFDFADITERYGVGGVVFMEGTINGDNISISGRMLSLGRSLTFPSKTYSLSDVDINSATLQALQAFQETWKSQNLIAGSPKKVLHATMQVTGLVKLQADLRGLQSLAIIDKAHLLRLSTRQALVAIDYRSSLEQLRATLFNNGLRLEKRGSTGHWQLRKL